MQALTDQLAATVASLAEAAGQTEVVPAKVRDQVQMVLYSYSGRLNQLQSHQ